MMQLFVDNLTVMDFSWLDPLRGLVGDSWIVDITLTGELDDQGMVFDFGHVKKKIKHIIDHEIDHKLVAASAMEGLTIHAAGKDLTLTCEKNGTVFFYHKSPVTAVSLLDATRVDKVSVGDYLKGVLLRQLPGNVADIALEFRREETEGDYYHYSHGLKKHDGNCQRIAHGHRSRIEIYLDGCRDGAMEHSWATRFQDIYIGTKQDLAEKNLLSDTHYCFAYAASQGWFEISLPMHKVYLIDTDSTVEWIAVHIANEIKRKHPAYRVIVKAFEGIGKGAICAL